MFFDGTVQSTAADTDVVIAVIPQISTGYAGSGWGDGIPVTPVTENGHPAFLSAPILTGLPVERRDGRRQAKGSPRKSDCPYIFSAATPGGLRGKFGAMGQPIEEWR